MRFWPSFEPLENTGISNYAILLPEEFFPVNSIRASEVASFLGRSHHQYFIASSMKYCVSSLPVRKKVFHHFQYEIRVFHTGSDEILVVGTAWERGYIRAGTMFTAYWPIATLCSLLKTVQPFRLHCPLRCGLSVSTCDTAA